MKFITLLITFTLAFFSLSSFETQTAAPPVEKLKNSSEEIIGKLPDMFQSTVKEFQSLRYQLSVLLFNEKPQPDFTPTEESKPNLKAPTNGVISIYNVELGQSKQSVEEELGKPKRISKNEYGSNWYTYHNHFQNFMMVSYDSSGKVNGLYSNHDIISSQSGIKHGSTRTEVHSALGEALDTIRKGNKLYKLDFDSGFEIYRINGAYYTIFYDKQEGNTVTGVQIISDSLEKQKNGYYAKTSKDLQASFEKQLFDLTNADRSEKKLPLLKWDEKISMTALNHSKDMARNNFFSHTNLEGESPFDRMADDGIAFSTAGENLAYGQNSAIFAHEGLMNSPGHRKNILLTEYRSLGIGVSFNQHGQPYYTENFYTKRY
ncbi:CAP domain-containing protein [Bacillus massilinigeriensis]|uniref:CAP domain-containing protein n=1 Tax=Bacillus mediterraneensis TaxID=1805474 RepID=UPI0008F8EE7C|nr:CAP-associated domain-containing protein [Bacillus mediterraneensis]